MKTTKIYEEKLTNYVLEKVDIYTEYSNYDFQEINQIGFDLLKEILKKSKRYGNFIEEYFCLKELNNITFLFFMNYKNFEK
ncbi:hypothetical protein PT447_00055 [Aliarcobacter butzleri]|uniref:hypothetical protein n=1 Tax=Aliarcobacter butzleri TaxID=28197 RepID=UPI0024DE067C|nr:hypothetical protein [Aliarcobacter butzleri]MDK2063311.1 hypothetical protein [Aliarcobacter butzleri]